MMTTVIITLIHGTWAPDAPWTQATSGLAKALSNAFGNVHFERFAWSGSNSHSARCRAATDLRQHIRNCKVSYPPQDHFLIAHSHGGNVLLYALRDKTVADSVRGVVCLSTPFIHCRHRALGPGGLWPIGLLAYFAYLWATSLGKDAILAAVNRMMLPILNRTTTDLIDEIITLILGVLLMVGGPIGLWMLVHWFVTRRFSVPDLAEAMERLENSFQFPKMTPASVLVIRARGDEASDALAISHFLSLLLTTLSRAFGLLVNFAVWLVECDKDRSAWYRVIYSLLFLLAGFATLAVHSRIFMILGIVLVWIGIFIAVFGFWLIALPVVAITGAPLLILVTLITIVSSPFGLDTALLAPRFEISAEATLPGRVTMLELSSSPLQGLQHSTAYGSEEAFNEITSWLRTRRSDRPEN